MNTSLSATANNPLLHLLKNTTVSIVASDAHDLTGRQLGVFLTVYLETGDHTVRGMASKLNVSKPAITRALDRLTEFDLVRREDDPNDSVASLCFAHRPAPHICVRSQVSCVRLNRPLGQTRPPPKVREQFGEGMSHPSPAGST